MKKRVYKHANLSLNRKYSIKIWGKSYCPYCDKAKALCKALASKEDLKYTYYQLDEDYTKEELLELFPNVKTLPQITVDDKYIGGYMELRTFLLGPQIGLFPDAWGNVSS